MRRSHISNCDTSNATNFIAAFWMGEEMQTILATKL